MWKRLGYACRYGHQPLSDLLAMGSYQVAMFVDALSDIVREENDSKGS